MLVMVMCKVVKSDQSSLCALRVAENPNFHHADSEDSDQMPSLILVLAGRACHKVAHFGQAR